MEYAQTFESKNITKDFSPIQQLFKTKNQWFKEINNTKTQPEGLGHKYARRS